MGQLLYRISSNLIPFDSHRINYLRWREEFTHELEPLGHCLRALRFRVSTDPRAIVAAAVAELEYHARGFLVSSGPR